jgi:hypothetical protein
VIIIVTVIGIEIEIGIGIIEDVSIILKKVIQLSFKLLQEFANKESSYELIMAF